MEEESVLNIKFSSIMHIYDLSVSIFKLEKRVKQYKEIFDLHIT